MWWLKLIAMVVILDLVSNYENDIGRDLDIRHYLGLVFIMVVFIL